MNSIFTRFNRKRIDDRQIDTLIGISKGLTADDQIDQGEAEFLHTWLIQNRTSTDHPIIVNLLERLDDMFADGVIDKNESEELLRLLIGISGEQAEFAEISKPATLPLNKPAPMIEFNQRTFLFTGTCAYGTRKQCKEAIENLGGINQSNVTKNLNYLIVGSYVTDSWAHESFGRKIEKAMQYRATGENLAIVSEEHWANCANL